MAQPGRPDADWRDLAQPRTLTLTFLLRPTVYDTAWEVTTSFDVEAGAEMDALSDTASEFFRQS